MSEKVEEAERLCPTTEPHDYIEKVYWHLKLSFCGKRRYNDVHTSVYSLASGCTYIGMVPVKDCDC